MKVIILGARSRVALAVANEMVKSGNIQDDDVVGINQASLASFRSGKMHYRLDYTEETLHQNIDKLLAAQKTNESTKIKMLISARTRDGETLSYLRKAVDLIHHLRRQGLDSVIFISSLAGSMVTNTQGWQYHAEKGAEQGVARWLAVENAKAVRVNVVELYHVEPDLKNESFPETQLSIHDLSNCILWLFSNAASSVTGQRLTLGTLRGQVIEPLETFPAMLQN